MLCHQKDYVLSLSFSDATINIEQLFYQLSEGAGPVEVCVEISDVPAGGLECDITVSLVAVDGAKAGKLNKHNIIAAMLHLVLLIQFLGRTSLHLIHWRCCSWQTWFPMEQQHALISLL